MEKPININEAVQRIKKVGKNNVRSIPMAGQNIHSGLYSIEIFEGERWITIAKGMAAITANNIISQAINKVICG